MHGLRLAPCPTFESIAGYYKILILLNRGGNDALVLCIPFDPSFRGRWPECSSVEFQCQTIKFKGKREVRNLGYLTCHMTSPFLANFDHDFRLVCCTLRLLISTPSPKRGTIPLCDFACSWKRTSPRSRRISWPVCFVLENRHCSEPQSQIAACFEVVLEFRSVVVRDCLLCNCTGFRP